MERRVPRTTWSSPFVACMLMLSACGPDLAAPDDALDSSQSTESLGQTLAVDDAKFDHALEYATAQMARSIVELSTTDIPRSITNADGTWNLTSAGAWTSGFYSGLLWQMHELTGESSWQTRARAQIVNLESQKTNGNDHDVGFRIFTSYGNAHRLTGDPTYRNVILTAAQTLASRYSPVVGCIKSQNRRRVFGGGDRYLEYPVLIDNMMNLELLFYAYQIGGDRKFYDIAVSHALKTITNHVRTDGGSYQYVDYNPETGSVVWKGTHQGYSNSSTWARGQAWGLYGFTMTYRYTQDLQFLATARQMADYFIALLPNDKVPYWDFNLPSTTGQPRDASAAAIAAAGLIELGNYVPQPNAYRETGLQILESLSGAPYLSEGTNRRSILLHSVGNYNSNSEVDVPLIYADYYFVEALLRDSLNTGSTPLPPPPPEPTVATVTITLAASSIEVGQTTQATATARDASGQIITGKTATWTISNGASVASVSSAGLVTGLSEGSAVVRATIDGVAGTATLTVLAAPPPPAPTVATVTVTLAAASIGVGQTTQATATARDASGQIITGKTATWTISNGPSVASVSSAGLVTGLAAGSATVTATIDGVKGSATLTVTSSDPPPSDTIYVHSADLDGVGVSVGKGYWKARVTFTIHDTAHQPVGGVTVSGGWSGGFSGTGGCVTGSNGTCSIESGTIPNNRRFAEFALASVTASKLIYVHSSNHDPDGDSSPAGEAISVRKP